MLEFIFGVVARSAVMVPTLIIVSAALWLLTRRLGLLKLTEPMNAYDMRTWPLSYALGDAAVFGLVFAAITALFNDQGYSIEAGAFTAAIAAMCLIPMMIANSRA